VQRNRNVLISDRDASVELELFLQAECTLPPCRALPRIAHSETEMSDNAKRKWHPA
jgi:hypothetical protein